MIPFQLHRRIPLVRRPFFQRDRALAERDRAVALLNRVEKERDRLISERSALAAERDMLAFERDALLVQRDQACLEVSAVADDPAEELAPAKSANRANVHTFMGYEIPIDLMLLTGGGPTNFDQISAMHMKNIAKYVGMEPKFTVLEIGCGIGRDAIPLTAILEPELGGHYIGIDIIGASIEWCVESIQARNPHFIFHRMNIADQLHNPGGTVAARNCYLPVPDSRVDRVIIQSVFTHMLRAEIEHYLAEIRRVMKPGALAYITTFLCDGAILSAARKTNLTPFDLRFEHEIEPGCFINDLAVPTGAVAYTRGLIDELIVKYGLRHARPPLQGAWSGYYPNPTDGQDVLILARA